MDDGDPRPVDVDRIRPGAHVGDVILESAVTPFLAAAAERGYTIQVGSDMLYEMVPALLEFFGFGAATPDELRLTARLP